jgi:hypothetical protein
MRGFDALATNALQAGSIRPAGWPAMGILPAAFPEIDLFLRSRMQFRVRAWVQVSLVRAWVHADRRVNKRGDRYNVNRTVTASGKRKARVVAIQLRIRCNAPDNATGPPLATVATGLYDSGGRLEPTTYTSCLRGMNRLSDLSRNSCWDSDLTPKTASRLYGSIHATGRAPFSVPVELRQPIPIRPSPPGRIAQTPGR